jgi:mycothiol maleylpyruvate isomerase-like protein
VAVAAAAARAAAADLGPPRVLPRERYVAEITASTASLGALIDGADLTLRVPTCPDWTLRQLATHVGRAQRWAAEIVSTRSAQAIAFRDVPNGRIPDDPAEHADGCGTARTG